MLPNQLDCTVTPQTLVERILSGLSFKSRQLRQQLQQAAHGTF